MVLGSTPSGSTGRNWPRPDLLLWSETQQKADTSCIRSAAARDTRQPWGGIADDSGDGSSLGRRRASLQLLNRISGATESGRRRAAYLTSVFFPQPRHIQPTKPTRHGRSAPFRRPHTSTPAHGSAGLRASRRVRGLSPSRRPAAWVSQRALRRRASGQFRAHAAEVRELRGRGQARTS